MHRWLVYASIVLIAGCQGPALQGPGGPLEGSWERQSSESLPLWRGNLGRTGYEAGAHVPAAVSKAWAIEPFNTGTHTAAKGSALAVNDTIYAAADSGIFYAIDLAGNLLWSAQTGPSGFGIHGTAAVAHGLVYIGAYDGVMYAYNQTTGALVWSTKVGGSIGSSPLVHDGLVYVSVETPEPNGHLSVLDAASGQEIWRDDAPTDHPHSSVSLDPETGILVFGANDGVLYAYNITTRSLAWTYQTGDAIKGPVLVAGGSVFFGSWDHHVYRVSLGGELLWRYRTGNAVMSGPGLDPNGGTLYIGSHDNRLYALDAQTGEPRWTYETGGRVISSPTVLEDGVLAGSYDGYLYALTHDGMPMWRYQLAGRVTSSPAIAGDLIIVADRAPDRQTPGSLVALRGSNPDQN